MHNFNSHRVMRSSGMKETEESDWDIFYADVGWIHENMPYGPGQLKLCDHQRVNHFPNHIELTRKDLMVKNLKRYRKQLEREGRHEEAAKFDFFPQTFALPSEAAMFIQEFKRDAGSIWIMKPIGRAQGKGIFLVNKLAQVNEWMRERQKKAEGGDICYENYVVQRYLQDPYLVGSKKFDLRLYVLCLSYNPLKAYLHREGFARFTAARYSSSKDDLSNSYIHLTNHAIQKKDTNYDPTVCDLKWPISGLKRHLISKHGEARANECFTEIRNLLINSLRAVAHVIINDRHCFELYGYDIMLDASLKPVLIEVNASPSMSADSETDRQLKSALLDDVFNVIDMENRFGGRLPARVGGFDLMCDSGTPLQRSEQHSSLTTLLGCKNNREESLRKLNACLTKN